MIRTRVRVALLSTHIVSLAMVWLVCRWTVEAFFQAGQGLAGLDAHESRRWAMWHRWTIVVIARPRLPGGTARDRTRPEPSAEGAPSR